jgi:hypothetical protein
MTPGLGFHREKAEKSPIQPPALPEGLNAFAATNTQAQLLSPLHGPLHQGLTALHSVHIPQPDR